ncbi:MAG: hypothetical protein OEW42_05290, partial [Acidimicrobiia bacterium]|nr:hypothetical protein [Acidimicrobiia bacterium]
MPDATDLDPDLLSSLELFNSHVEQTATEAKAAKIVAKAERRKDEAAARVRKLTNDNRATAEQKSEAEAAYREAVAELAARKDDPFGRPAGSPAPASAEADTDPPQDPTTDPGSAEADTDPPQDPTTDPGSAEADTDPPQDPTTEPGSAEGDTDPPQDPTTEPGS